MNRILVVDYDQLLCKTLVKQEREKKFFARAIHENSPDKSSDFVVADCASLSENLLGFPVAVGSIPLPHLAFAVIIS